MAKPGGMRFTGVLTAVVVLLAAFYGAPGRSSEFPALPPELAGHWFNTEQNDTVGLVLNKDKSCVLYTSRLTVPKSERACKFEFYADKTYFIYLKGTDGVCSTEADFEFRYYQDQARIDLQVGGGSQFLLSKKPISPSKTP